MLAFGKHQAVRDEIANMHATATALCRSATHGNARHPYRKIGTDAMQIQLHCSNRNDSHASTARVRQKKTGISSLRAIERRPSRPQNIWSVGDQRCDEFVLWVRPDEYPCPVRVHQTTESRRCHRSGNARVLQ